MPCYDNKIIWIPYTRRGEIDLKKLKEQIEEYSKHDKEWKNVELNPKLPYLFEEGGKLETLKCTAIAVTHSSPGCVWFYQEGVLVKFEWPQ